MPPQRSTKSNFLFKTETDWNRTLSDVNVIDLVYSLAFVIYVIFKTFPFRLIRISGRALKCVILWEIMVNIFNFYVYLC